MSLIDLIQDRGYEPVAGCCVYDNEPWASINYKGFLGLLNILLAFQGFWSMCFVTLDLYQCIPCELTIADQRTSGHSSHAFKSLVPETIFKIERETALRHMHWL